MPVAKSLTVKTACGQVEVFYVSQLAESLGRTAQTVRKWEIAGIMPKSIFTDKTGKRLYSQEQIDTIVRCAEEAHVRTGYSIANTSFSEKVTKALKELNKKYVDKK